MPSRRPRSSRHGPRAKSTGFCWGGNTTNVPAALLCAKLQADVPFCGAATETAAAPAIRWPLLIQYAERDERLNALWPAFDAAPNASKVPH